MTTTATFSIGQKVCRRSCRTKITGMILSIGSTTARVQWDRSQMGLVRLGSGKSQASRVRLSELVDADAFVSRPLSGPAEEAWIPCRVLVNHRDGSGVSEAGRNLFDYPAAEEAKAVEHGQRLAAEGRHVTVSRQESATWVPDGCRVERQKYRWITLLKT